MGRKKPSDHPDVIAAKAKQMPWKENARVNVSSYEDAILTLRERGYSYGDIAKWLSKELNAPVKRGQVYYVCKVESLRMDQEDQEAYARGEMRVVPSVGLSEEEMEKVAKEEDSRRQGKRRR